MRGHQGRSELLAVDYRVRNAARYMREALSEPFDTDKVAIAAGVSRAHLFRIFQNAMQITPALYFNVLRMEAAIDSLVMSGESVTELSERLGFAAPSHFTRFFRNNQGITPTDYRHEIGRAH